MGTRSLTRFYTDEYDNEPGKKFAVMYRQFDGYPSGHGLELAEFLAPIVIVNGLGCDKGQVANGMSCLAAQIIAHFKTEPGGIYLYPANTKDCWEEFVYDVRGKVGQRPHITILKPVFTKKTYRVKGYKEIASGFADEILAKIKNNEITGEE